MRVHGFCPSTVVEWFYMRHATRSLSKWIRLTFCDSYELRVFPCSKITKIYLALICQCSIGPPKKHRPICGLFHSFFLNRGELVRAGAYQKAGTNKNSTSIGGEFKYFAHGGSHFCCTQIRSMWPISYYLPAVYIAYLSPASWHICFLNKWLLLQQYFVYLCKWRQIEMNQPKTSVQLYIHIYIYM